MKRALVFLAALLALCVIGCIPLPETIPGITSPVTDQADVLTSGEITTLEQQINNYHDSTGNWIYVLIVKSVGDSSIDDYAHDVFNHNRLGDSTKDNGVLLVVASEDKQARIEVGYGLEPYLTDLECGRIVKGEDTPMGTKFNDGDWVGGISAAISGIIQGIGGEYTAPDGKKEITPQEVLIGAIILFILFIILWIVTGSPLEAALIILRIVAIAACKGGGGGGGGRSGGGGSSGRW